MHYNLITMVMQTVQVRLPKGLVKEIDAKVRTGRYANRSDVIRESVRTSIWDDEIGTVQRQESGVALARKAREHLSNQIKSFKDIEKINKEVFASLQ